MVPSSLMNISYSTREYPFNAGSVHAKSIWLVEITVNTKSSILLGTPNVFSCAVVEYAPSPSAFVALTL